MRKTRPIRSPADALALVQNKAPETTTLEFKLNLGVGPKTDKPSSQKAQKELCRDVSQFANAEGGCLVVGIREERVDGVGVAIDIVPLPAEPDPVQWIEQAIRNYCVPATFAKGVHVLGVNGGNIVVVDVPASLHLVSVWDQESHTIEALRRTHHGKDWMNPDELEQHLMNGSRATRLAVVRAYDEAHSKQGHIDLAPGVFARGRDVMARQYIHPVPSRTTIIGVEDHELILAILISDTSFRMNVPYGLVREAWITADHRVGLYLNTRLMLERGELVWGD